MLRHVILHALQREELSKSRAGSASQMRVQVSAARSSKRVHPALVSGILSTTQRPCEAVDIIQLSVSTAKFGGLNSFHPSKCILYHNQDGQCFSHQS